MDSRFKNSNPTYMTVPEAADYMRIPTKTLYRMILNDIIPAYRLSERKILLKQHDINKYIEAQKF